MFGKILYPTDFSDVAGETLAYVKKPQVKAMVREGHPAHEILKVAAEEEVDALVIGSHGRSNIREMLLGSVSESVVRKSPRPVLVVKR